MAREYPAGELASIVGKHFGTCPLPYLVDSSARARARRLAGETGLFERLEQSLHPEEPVAVLPYSRFRDYRRNGNRTRYEEISFKRAGQIRLAAAACYLGMDYAEYLQDLLWAQCESTWWILPAHENRGRTVDLFSAMTACESAQIMLALEELIGEEVCGRLTREIRRRVVDPFLVPGDNKIWKAVTFNWNPVCNGAIAIAALLTEKDDVRLGAVLHEVLNNVRHFIEAFPPDGGCSEGPGYWRFGFGWYVKLAAAMYDFSGGEINLMDAKDIPNIENICRYPLAMTISPGRDVCFADAKSGYLPYLIARLINRFCDIPELYSLCRRRPDGRCDVELLEEAALYDGEKLPEYDDRKEYFLPDLAVAKFRAGPTLVALKAGNNAEHHNHNDVGSYVVHRGGTTFLDDPGSPIYSKATFHGKRYESVYINSRGHSVPVIDGQLQRAGAEFAGTLEVTGLDAGGTKSARVELARAYGLDSLEGLTRRIELADDGGQVTISDEYVFRSPPASVEEAFITFCPVEVVDGALAVLISSESAGAARLVALDTPGVFDVAELVEESRAEDREGRLIRRITFTPEKLSREMTLKFVLRFE